MLFLVHKTSYSVFEIRSFGNIGKTGSEYLKTLGFLLPFVWATYASVGISGSDRAKKKFVGMHEERGKMKRRRVSCQLSTPVYLVVLDLATTHAAVSHTLYIIPPLFRSFFLKKGGNSSSTSRPQFLGNT